MDGAREQRPGQGGVDPRLTALDEGARLDGSLERHLRGPQRRGRPPGTGPPEARQGRPALVQVLVTDLEVATASASGTFRKF
jgi:hypothetical protein